ncbi:hypothetical protein, partial [Citrobacter freundii]|uniref:hypothetical protein n=1 Tax=Citrobacter sp. FDAARGOS_156 TaxID=1702170 RepID=UPI001CD79D4C
SLTTQWLKLSKQLKASNIECSKSFVLLTAQRMTSSLTDYRIRPVINDKGRLRPPLINAAANYAFKEPEES